jgi:hypothetical protein
VSLFHCRACPAVFDGGFDSWTLETVCGVLVMVGCVDAWFDGCEGRVGCRCRFAFSSSPKGGSGVCAGLCACFLVGGGLVLVLFWDIEYTDACSGVDNCQNFPCFCISSMVLKTPHDVSVVVVFPIL